MTHNYEGNAGIPLYAIKSISLKQKCGISVRRRKHKVLNKENHALGLCGSKNSFYLRLVDRHAQKAGIKTIWTDKRQSDCVAYVADMDSGNAKLPSGVTVEEDVDRITHWGVSCVALAALSHMGYQYPVIIIGRGHSVQGMAEILTMNRIPVSVVHSETDYDAVQFRGCCVVNSAPLLSTGVSELCAQAAQVVDISGSLFEVSEVVSEYVGRKEIGKENLDILMDRVKRKIDEATENEKG